VTDSSGGDDLPRHAMATSGPPEYGPVDRREPGYRTPYGTSPVPAAAGPPPGRTRAFGTVTIALVTALLGGLIGGAVGYGAAERSGVGRTLPAVAGGVPAPVDPVSPVEAVAQRVLPSVVQLRVDGPGGAGEGSGIVLDADGLLLTNNHVVDAAASAGRVSAVFRDGTIAPARIVGRDPSSDLAVLRAGGVAGLTPVALGDSDAVRVGQQVVAFGSPLGLGGTVTTGIISALDRAVSVGQESGTSEATVLSALQTDAAINPGNSGGPLVDMQGALIGINSVIATTGAEGGSIGVGFSIPVNQAKRVADELDRTGRATRPVLGVGIAGRNSTANGAVIGQITPGGQAGIHPNEVVTRLNNRLVMTGDELVAAIRDRAPGEKVTLTVDGRRVDVTLGGQTG
jgi:putative serine protease PepD